MILEYSGASAGRRSNLVYVAAFVYIKEALLPNIHQKILVPFFVVLLRLILISTMSLSPSEQVLNAQQIGLTAYMSVAFSTVIFYDHIITTADEIDYIWRGKHRFNGASYIFLANRLAALVYGVGLLAQIFNWDTKLGCIIVSLVFYASNIVLYLVATVFSALRAYAISGEVSLVAGLVFALGLGPVCINTYEVIASSSFFVIWTGNIPVCAQASRYNVKVAQTLYCVSGALAILSDMIVIAVTWYRTHTFGKQARHNRTPFMRMILRDGTMYFVTMLILNIAETGVATVWFNDATVNDSYTAYFTIPFLQPRAHTHIALYPELAPDLRTNKHRQYKSDPSRGTSSDLGGLPAASDLSPPGPSHGEHVELHISPDVSTTD
ncbi:hypothetical protein C8Q72DRAFT_795330 [Fomitopsis betulina]|nr:hypothetical protein C8Q72DRAFT_795330 [Fomitopsis betulina]